MHDRDVELVLERESAAFAQLEHVRLALRERETWLHAIGGGQPAPVDGCPFCAAAWPETSRASE